MYRYVRVKDVSGDIIYEGSIDGVNWVVMNPFLSALNKDELRFAVFLYKCEKVLNAKGN